MSRAHSAFRTLIAVAACLAVLAVVQKLQDNDSSAAQPGLTATFSGKAFAAGPGSQAPVMKVAGLRQGQATSGTVTVRNPGPGTRYFWLSPGKISERLGRSGGRLSSAVSLTVMDVTDISSPSVVYRGPLRYVGARPLGFLSPGARRSFSFLAELPNGGRSPVAPAVDPYRGATASIAWTWHSLTGRPDSAAPSPTPAKPRERDQSAPKLAFSVPGRQQLLERRALNLTVRCTEDCTAETRSTLTAGGRRFRLTTDTARAAQGLQRSREVTVRFPGAAAGALRSSLVGGATSKVRVDVEAYDRSGNRRGDGHTITLRAQR